VNSDPLYDFIASIFESDGGKDTHHYSKQKLHRVYLEWCSDNAIPEHKRKTTLISFTSALQIHGFVPAQKKEKKIVYETYSTSTYILKREIKTVDLGYATGSIF
jgi:phage/plasmid-associated DNA primase